MIAEGKHNAKAVQWEWGLTKDGKDQMAVQFEIVEGEAAGTRLTWYGYFTDKSQERTLQALRYCGWKNDDIVNMEGMGDLLVQIVVGYEEQTVGKNAGKIVAKVQWVNQLGGGGPIKLDRPMDANQKRMFAARMKLFAKMVPPVQGGYPVANRAKTEEGGAADAKAEDEPF